MTPRTTAGARRVRTLTAATVAIAAALLFSAFAATASAAILIIDTEAPVDVTSCVFCHADPGVKVIPVAGKDGAKADIVFKHGKHMRYECTSCHSEFPHKKGVTAKLTMEGCWDCHGLQHGPAGTLADGDCTGECHQVKREQLRPTWHTADWAGAGHVERSLKELRTTCMRCHDGEDCDSCHQRTGVTWSPKEPYTYDPRSGCMSCHDEDKNLTKVLLGQLKSFAVTGLATSAHADIGCTSCHPDFKYEDSTDATKLWAVNAGLACQSCHAKDKKTKAVVAAYAKSVHGKKVAAGDYASATCASCHAGHNIKRLDTQAAKNELHGSAYAMCAQCHEEQYASYDDYYHGKAYKRGELDAPACWQCHESHGVLPAADKNSAVNPARLAKTCGTCHDGSEESFTEQTGALIHRKPAVLSANGLRRLIASVTGLLRRGD